MSDRDFEHNVPEALSAEELLSEKTPEQIEVERKEKQELISRATGAIREFVDAQENWESGGQPEEPEPLTPEARIGGHAGLWADGRRREHLPIDAKLAEIHELLEKNQVVIVEAETGAGKTTRIPQYELTENLHERITMTQTRRNAVRWNGKRIAGEMGSAPGGVVGWRLFGEDPMVSRETRLTLTVDQSVTNRIRKNEGKLPKGLLVVDEAHERSISTDLLIGLLKERLAASPETKVLITSATIDTKKFSEFFGDAPIVSVKGRVFPVSTEVEQLQKFEHHTQGASRAAESVLERFTKGELAVPTSDGSGTQNVPEGTVVVLLPGKDDIRDVMASLQRAAKRLEAENKVEVLSCHGESTPEEQDRVQAPLRPGTLRFVCGTEVLRSSVTVQNTIGVIDSLQIKRLISDAKGVGHLDKIAVSKAEADQGKGRAGRTHPGFYIPVSFESEYARLNPYPTPAILQQPITNVVLQVAAIDRSARDFAFIDKPPADKLETALTRLKRIGALDAEEKITETGEMLVQFPLDPERAKVLLVAEKLGVLSEAVIAAGVLEAENVFFSPNREQKTCVVEEPTMRKILSHVEKQERSYGGEYWTKLYEPRDPATVDLAVLPKWAKKKGEYWEVDTSDYDFPIEDGVRGISNVVRKQWAGTDGSDFATIVRAYRAFKSEERQLRDAEPPRGGRDQQRESAASWRRRVMQEWCERNFINQKRMREAERIMHEILDELDNSPLRTENRIAYNRNFNAESLTKALAAGLTDNVARKSGRGFTGPIVERGQDFQIGRESVCPGGSELVIVSGVRKIPTRRQSFFYLADLAAPIKKEWLKEVMPQLCTSRREADAAYSPDADAVLETESSFYADLDLGQEKVPAPYTAENAQRFARWLAGYNAARDTKNEKLKAVLSANDTQQQRAANLNLRIGEAKLKQYSNEEIFAFYSEKLAGAWKQSEVENPDDLRFPSLEDAEVEKVLSGYPDKISIWGSETEVTYAQEGRRSETGEYANVMVARVNLGDLSEGNKWMQIPDEGIKLPSGLPVEIQISIKRDGSYWGENFSNTDIVALKEKITGHLNRSLWEAWKERPEIAAPNPEDDDAIMPAIATASYGASVVDGTPLMAYGTITFNSNRYYSTDSRFKTEWFSVRSEAEEAHAKAETELARLKNERRDQRELKGVQEAAQQSKDRLNELYDKHHYDSEIEQDLRSKLYARRYESLPRTTPELKQWKLDTDVVIGEVEAALTVGTRKKEEENQKLRALARPILRTGQPEGEGTIYGMPCNDEGPCEAGNATEWRLYSYRDGKLVRHKGFRSSSYGTTFAELIRDYMRGESDVEEVLRNLPSDAHRKGKQDPVLEAVGGDSEMAHRAKEFAETAQQYAGGNLNHALRILERESTAPYGRARRQAAIEQNLPGIKETEVGQRFLGASRASDVDSILSGAVAWLQSQLTAPPIPEQGGGGVMKEERPAPLQDTSTAADALRAAFGYRTEVTAPPPLPPRERMEQPKPEPEAMTPELQNEFITMLDLSDTLAKQMTSQGLKLPDLQHELLRSTRRGLERMGGRPSTVRGQIRTVLASIESQYKKKGVEAGWTKKILDLWNTTDEAIAKSADAQEYIREGIVSQEALAEGVHKKIIAGISRVQEGQQVNASDLLFEQLKEL